MLHNSLQIDKKEAIILKRENLVTIISIKKNFIVIIVKEHFQKNIIKELNIKKTILRNIIKLSKITVKEHYKGSLSKNITEENY